MPSTPTKPSPTKPDGASDLSRASAETVGEHTEALWSALIERDPERDAKAAADAAAWEAWRARDAAAAAARDAAEPRPPPRSAPVFAAPASVLEDDDPPGEACAAVTPPVLPHNPPGARPATRQAEESRPPDNSARPVAIEDPRRKRKRGRAARRAQRIKNNAQSARTALQDLREREPDLAARWIELNGTRSRQLRSSSRARLSLALLSFWLEIGVPAAYYRVPAKRFRGGRRGRGGAPTLISRERASEARCVRVCGITQAYLAETFGVSTRTITRVYRELREAKIIDTHQLPVGAKGQYEYEIGRVRIHRSGARTQFACSRVYVFTALGAKPALYRPPIPDCDVTAWAARIAA